MYGSGRKSILGILPLLLLMAACDSPVTVVVEAEPEEVETCEWLIPIGIELVNDYFYTLEEADLGDTGGDMSLLPASIVALNTRGEELDRRAAELSCDLDELNRGIVGATEGLESTDPVIQVFLDTVRSGLVGAPPSIAGSWVFTGGSASGSPIEPEPHFEITLTIGDDGVGSGTAVCNEYSFTVLADEGEWVSDRFSITAAECPDAAETTIGQAYVQAFVSTDRYAIDEETLVLNGPDTELQYVRKGRIGSPENSAQP